MNSRQNFPLSVLIIEHDNDLANSIRLYLEDTFLVYAMAGTSLLVEYISKYNINFIIIDLDTPDPDLKEKLKSVKVEKPEVKTIVIYMFMDEDGQNEFSILKEADDCICKPFDADILKYKLNKLISQATVKNTSS